MRTLTVVDRPEASSGGDTPPRDAPLEETSILIVAEQALVRAGLRAVIGATPGLAVVADARDVADAVALVARCRPDVVLLQAPPDGATDAAPLAALRRAAPGTCVLYLADRGAIADETAISGALPCVPCDAGVADFCAAIGTLLGGRCAACALRARCPAPRVDAALSRRERQVAVRVAAGLTTKQIAAALGLSVRTVNTYRESLARKIGASTGAVLTRYVLEHGLAASDPRTA